MRPLEIALLLGLIVLGTLILARTARGLQRLLLYLCLVVACLHLWHEGAHWQMAPAYLALLAAIPLALARAGSAERPRNATSKLAGLAVLLLSAMAAALCIALPVFLLPPPTGPYPVGTRTLYLEDSARHEPALPDPAARRRLVVQLWYPAAPSNHPLAPYRSLNESDLLGSYQSLVLTHSRTDAPVAGKDVPFPVLLFSHGIGGRRGALTNLMEDLASHGYVVASIDYPYLAARVTWKDGQVLRSTRRFRILYPDPSYTPAEMKAEWDDEAALAAADQSFVLDTLARDNDDARSPWYHRLNTSLVGAFGHSFGGAAAQRASTTDPRIRSSLNIDGWSLGGLDPNTAKPVMYLYGDLDTMRMDDPLLLHPPRNNVDVLTWADVAAIKRGLQQHGGYVINITNTNHADFTDRTLLTTIPLLRRRSELGPIKPDEILAIVRSYVLAFFNQTLLNEPSPLLDPQLPSPFPEVTFQRWLPADPSPSAAPTKQQKGAH